ncbi:type III-A CRISPR-associated RAMP protein Csm4 [Methanothermococcus sp. SCGC AD-155-C09]|nr:type III-A CRISPR-associated RAMP protein Csm4 [Methanothermococcus sp. SCGC AD-155-C09]
MHIVKLIPYKNSKYHFGEGDLSESSLIFHSNSLFSTIVNNFIKLYGVEEFNNYKEEIKKLKISSLFPAIYKFKNKENPEIEDEILFIPKPMVRLGFDENTQKDIEEKPKDFKKIKFISMGALKKHSEGTLKKITIGKEYLISDDEKRRFNYNKPENMDLFNSIIEKKVSIDRVKEITLEHEGRGQLYSIEFIKPLRKKDKIVGFYFLIDFNNIDGELLNKIKASIRLIKDEGLGGKRSIGAGFFKDIILDEFNMEDLGIDNKYKNKTHISKEKHIVLSITIPKEEEFKNFYSYQLIKIGGYIYSSSNMGYITKLKRSVYVLREGSICEKPVEGQILDLRPDDKNTVEHEVILNGCPILIPIVSYEEVNEGNL